MFKSKHPRLILNEIKWRYIPYHRIVRIEYDTQKVFER